MLGALDLFRVGIGPSSSHTVGPMRAAWDVARRLPSDARTLEVHLYGSLAATGVGHGTPDAILAGVAGHSPETVDIDRMRADLAEIRATGRVRLRGRELALGAPIMHPLTVLDSHPNGMRFMARSGDTVLFDETWFSVGGGFVTQHPDAPTDVIDDHDPIPFTSGTELLQQCAALGRPIWWIARENEVARRGEEELEAGIRTIWCAMSDCIDAGLAATGELPGGLTVQRRARAWHEKLLAEDHPRSPEFATEWIDVYALAVNEENAAGGRVVTAPTNGAAGIVPAVLRYACEFLPIGNPAAAVQRFLLTAAAVGALYKTRASISGAEVGCQGEVGSASSMAAAGLAELLGATPAQVENAAEIAMEHNLGLSCDPVGGLVQIPCIERNAVAAAQAVNAARMAVRGDGTHRVSLDQVIETMRQTGHDMLDKYKETSRGGLAVNVIEC